MIVVIIAKRSSPIASFLALGRAVAVAISGMVLAGELLGERVVDFKPFGRHFKTASTEALQGCTWRGYENITRMTIAAFAIVDAIEGMSETCQLFPVEIVAALTHSHYIAGNIISKG